MMTTPLLKAVEIVGGQSTLARILGVSPQAVQQWCGKERVPAKRVLPIEVATGGRISRYELRPDIYPRPDQDDLPSAKFHH